MRRLSIFDGGIIDYHPLDAAPPAEAPLTAASCPPATALRRPRHWRGKVPNAAETKPAPPAAEAVTPDRPAAWLDGVGATRATARLGARFGQSNVTRICQSTVAATLATLATSSLVSWQQSRASLAGQLPVQTVQAMLPGPTPPAVVPPPLAVPPQAGPPQAALVKAEEPAPPVVASPVKDAAMAEDPADAPPATMPARPAARVWRTAATQRIVPAREAPAAAIRPRPVEHAWHVRAHPEAALLRTEPRLRLAGAGRPGLALPHWLTQGATRAPKVLVMSEPPHMLGLPYTARPTPEPAIARRVLANPSPDQDAPAAEPPPRPRARWYGGPVYRPYPAYPMPGAYYGGYGSPYGPGPAYGYPPPPGDVTIQ